MGFLEMQSQIVIGNFPLIGVEQEEKYSGTKAWKLLEQRVPLKAGFSDQNAQKE